MDMIFGTHNVLQRRWERYGTWTWANNPRQSEDAA
jgi:hypothetical protein